jgi:hypothetical protein
LNNNRRATDARQEAYNIDSEAEYQRDVANGDGIVADFRKVGRDVLNSGAAILEDPAIAGDIVAEGTGSLLLGGPVIKGASVAGKSSILLLKKGGVIRTAAALRAARRANDVAAPAIGIAALESGGTYTQTTSEVLNMSTQKLMENSEEFRNLVLNEGMDADTAKRKLASEAGLVAAALTAPAAAGLGSIVGKFASNPLKPTGVSTALRNTAGETVEEAGQGAASQAATNLAVQDVDPDRNIVDGIGEQITAGAIGLVRVPRQQKQFRLLSKLQNSPLVG